MIVVILIVLLALAIFSGAVHLAVGLTTLLYVLAAVALCVYIYNNTHNKRL